MENNLTYTRNGDYLIPDLSLSEQRSKPLGKYGRMRKAYLKEHRPLIYNHLLMSEKLYSYRFNEDGKLTLRNCFDNGKFKQEKFN